MTRAREFPQVAVLLTVSVLLVCVGCAQGTPVLTLPPDLSPQEQQRLRRVTERFSVATSVRGRPFVMRQGMFEYLLDHPEFATYLMRMLEVGDYSLTRRTDGLWFDDGGGAVGHFTIVYAAPGRRLVHLRGHYSEPWVPRIHGEVVVELSYVTQPRGDGFAVVTPVVTEFARLDNIAVHALSKVLRGTARAEADRLARRIVGDFAETAEKIEASPRRMYEDLRRRGDVPGTQLEEFRRLLKIS